jgi:hypothetical protein
MYWLYYGQRLGWNHEMSDPNCHMTSLACQRNEHVANPLFRIQTPKQNGREDFATNCQVKCAALGLTWMYHTSEREMSAWPGGLGSLESEEQLQNKRNHQNQKGNEHGSTMFNIFKYFQSTKKKPPDEVYMEPNNSRHYIDGVEGAAWSGSRTFTWECLDHEGNMLRTNKIKMRKLNRSIGP